MIIGGGLFGSVIAKALLALKYDVCVIDGGHEDAGSKPAACLMKPGWFASLGRDIYDPALKTLDALYGLQEVQFKLGPAMVKVFWIPPRKILQAIPFVQGRVSRYTRQGKYWQITLMGGVVLQASLLIVAAGIWTELLVPEVRQKGMAGIAFLWPKSVVSPFIKPWAPFKQIVAFNRDDGAWISDGSAILLKNWNDAREQACFSRCVATQKLPADPTRLFGLRPYHVAKPCYLEEVRPKLWVATGGAKNGTLAAGWCASQLAKAL